MKTIDELKKIIRILILILLIALVVYVLIFVFPNKKASDTGEETINGYTLYKRDSELYKEIFLNMKEELEGNIDFSEYAKYVSELFVIDLYTLSNKNYESDVSASQYVYSDMKDNFIESVSNTLYRNIKLLDELPTVTSINVEKVEESTFKIDNDEYDAYDVYLTWQYDNDYDYGYDTSKVITLIKNDNVLSIVKIGDVIDE